MPPAAAGEMLRALVLGLRELYRADGGEVSPAMRLLLYALHDAAEDQDQAEAFTRDNARSPEAGFGTESASADRVTVAQAASLLGCSLQWVRHLARRGTLPATRAGRRAWLIDRQGLDDYRHGGTAA